jgi:hypothetical protein
VAGRVRLTPDTPLAAIQELVERTVGEHQGRTPGITFTLKTSGQPASYTAPARPEFYVLRHFYRQTALYAAIVSSRPM